MIGSALPRGRVRGGGRLRGRLGGDRGRARRGRVRRRRADRRAQRDVAREGRADRRAVVPGRRGRRGPVSASASWATSSSAPSTPTDLVEAVVHGVLHLTGMDHETDEGEMLAVQAEIMGVAAMSTARASWRWRAGRTSASRRWSTRWSATRSRSSPTSRRPRGARSAACVTVPGPVPARADRPAGRPAPARRADRRACSGAWSPSWPRPTRRCSSSTATRAWAARATASSPRRSADARVPVVIARQQGRPAQPRRAPSRALQIATELGLPDAEVFPISARTGQRRPAAARLPRRPAARGPVLLPARGLLRPARGRDARRAGARAGARAHPPGGPALGRGPGRGDRAARGPRSSSARRCGWRPSPRRAS